MSTRRSPHRLGVPSGAREAARARDATHVDGASGVHADDHGTVGAHLFRMTHLKIVLLSLFASFTLGTFGCTSEATGDDPGGDATEDGAEGEAVAQSESALSHCVNRSAVGGHFTICEDWYDYVVYNRTNKTRRVKVDLNNARDTECKTIGVGKSVRFYRGRFFPSEQGIKACD